ncbi:MAG: ATP-dependent helicase [Thermodesulfobacteriota bacterium]
MYGGFLHFRKKPTNLFCIMDTATISCIDYLGDLNPAQWEVVSAGEGPTLVVAGAGSGKTRAIVYRVAWLVEQGIDPSQILLLTFTRKASQEMLRRAAELLDQRVARVSGGTFHSTGYMLLRRYGRLLGYEASFSIMDQSDSLDAFEHIKSHLDPAPAVTKAFPKARTVAEIIGKAVNTGKSVETIVARQFPHMEEFAEDIERIRTQYESFKLANNLMDYDDLLVNTVKLLEEHEHARTEIISQWTYVLVDEYQDTNELQAKMLRLLASAHSNVMAVGDDCQSIYSFRGATIQNILDFPHIFSGTRTVKLEENYRSTAPILALTNAVIRRATLGYEKTLFTRRANGTKPLWVRPPTEREQSRFVLECVNELRLGGIPLREVAVLFRAGFHSFDLEGELTRNDVPYVKHGGFKFLESRHIKDVLAHLRVLGNPGDRLAWMRVLKLLPGIGPKTATKLGDLLAVTGIPDKPASLVTKGSKWSIPFQDLAGMLNALKNHTGPISEKVEQVNRYYFPYLKEQFDNYPKRMRDLEQLADLTLQYKSLNRFINDMALEPPDEDGNDRDAQENSLVLSTIHSAKGLEWHTVILIWVAEGRLPSPAAAVFPDQLEEERRLTYVAMTRAKQNLVILTPQTYLDRAKGVVPVAPSRFLAEVSIDYFRTV